MEAWFVWSTAVVAILAVLRLALPFALQAYVNRLLARNPKYQGTVGDVDVALYRGAYTIHDIDIRKRGARVPVPFVKAPSIDVSLEWAALVEGSVVGELELDHPQLNFVAGPTEAERQTGSQGEWWDIVQKLFPVGLNRLEVRDGRIHFRNFTSQPKVDVYLDHVDLIASNLENSRRSAEPRPASLEVRGDFKRQGRMVLHASLDPHARAPSFDCDFVAQGIALADWNDFLRAYAKLDAESGQLAVYAELLAQDGSFRGYVKPFLQDASVLDWNDDVVKQSLVSTAWQAFAQGVLELFKNRDTNQVATRIPVSGSAKSPHGEFWPALGNGLWNAFVEALTPQLEHGIRSR
jgi:hypothetical protein